MKLYLSENLKRLRRSADITQDKLAEFLCVTPQTVSKWERAETYPDIETLPAIANYFGVTIDELLGNDIMKTEADIDRLIAEIMETAFLDEVKALEMSRDGYRRYPYSYKMMVRYGKDLCLYSYGDAWSAAMPEVRRLAELILDGCTDDQLRYDAIGMLGSVYSDDPAEYEKVCGKVPDGFDFTRELWLENLHRIDTKEGLALRQKNMMEFVWWFIDHVESLCGKDSGENGGPTPDPDERIDICRMKLALFKGIFRDGDYLSYAWHLAMTYNELAGAYLANGDIDDALSALESMAHFVIMYRELPAYAKHTSYLVSELDYDVSRLPRFGSCGSPEHYLHMMKDQMWDHVRENPRFTAVKQRLIDCPEGVRPRDEEDYMWLRGVKEDC